MANARGPIRTGEPWPASTSACAGVSGTSARSVHSAVVSAPQQRHVLAPKRYSVTIGAGTGGQIDHLASFDGSGCRSGQRTMTAGAGVGVDPNGLVGVVGQRSGHPRIAGLLAGFAARPLTGRTGLGDLLRVWGIRRRGAGGV